MASLKKCIEEKCKDCTYDHAAPGTWREQVELCTVKRCALWPVRPMTVATMPTARCALKLVALTWMQSLLAWMMKMMWWHRPSLRTLWRDEGISLRPLRHL